MGSGNQPFKGIPTSEKMRDALRQARGSELDDSIWRHLVRKGVVDQAVQDVPTHGFDLALADLLAAYDLEAEFAADLLGGNTKGGRRKASRHEIPADARASALSEIIALEASRLPVVESFQRDVLNGRLLRPTTVPGWIRRRASEDGKATWRVKPAVGDWGEESVPETLSYPSEEGARTVFIRLDGTLGRLKRVVETLVRRFPLWREAGAIDFVLTGQPPAPRLAFVTTRRDGQFRAMDSIALEVSPRVAPRELASLYADVRASVMDGSRDRGVSSGRIELGLFAAKHNDGRSWREALESWNAQHPERRYADWKRFARDCRAGYEGITGAKLIWRGRRYSPDGETGVGG